MHVNNYNLERHADGNMYLTCQTCGSPCTWEELGPKVVQSYLGLLDYRLECPYCHRVTVEEGVREVEACPAPLDV